MTRHQVLIPIICVCATAAAAQVPSLADEIRAAEAHVTSARPRTVAEAEAEGASYPRPRSTAATARTCTTIRPEQIVFPSPTPTGDPKSHNLSSGDFFAGSISFGWGDNYEQAKMPLEPRRPDLVGTGLWLRVIRLDQPGEGPTFELDRLNGGYPFFPSWPRFPTPGKWMLIATAGVNWGCFVLDRPVKTRLKL
jgi:hypothetical protein